MKGIVKIVILLLIFLESVQTKAQSCTGSLGDPVVNVTFGAGASIGAALPTGQTNYTYSGVTCIQDGFYGIRTTSVANATDNNTCYGGGWLLSTRDHTGDTNGYMMVVNASFSPGEFFKTTISGLCGGTTYEFSSWIMNLLRAGSCSTNPQRFPNVTFNIETTSGTVLKTFSTGSIPETSSPQWNRYATFFTTPTGVSTVVLRLVNNAPGGCGNDLALDDIQFRACGPTLTTKFLNTNSATAKICIGQSFTLNATLSSGYNNPVFQWQVSTDATNWTNISGATTTTYTLTPATSGIYYYRVLASESGNINLVTCRIASTPTLVGTVTPYPDLVTSGVSICTGTCTDLSILFTDNTALLPNSTVSIKYFNTLADAQANVNQLTSSVVCPTASRSYFVSKTVNGCNDILEIPITVNPLPAINAGSNSAICQGQTLNLTTTNGGAGATYSWSGPNSFASTLQNPSIAAATSTQNGTYSLTVTLSGCTATATTSVIVKPLPTVGASNNSPICQGQTLTLSSVNGGTGATYLWNGPSGYSSVLQNPTISGVTPAANGVYTSTVTLNGCTATATTNAAIRPLPNTLANSNSSVCVGNTLNLLGSGGVTGAIYQWSGPNNFTSGLQNPSITTVTTAANGTYSLNVILNGCSASSTTAVTVNPLPTPTASSNTPVCVGKSLDLTSNGGVSYTWIGPNGFSSSLQNPSINPVSASATGIYTVTVTNANGCSATATTNVVINALPVPTVSSNSPVCVGKSLDLSSSGGVSYAWVGPNAFSSSLQNLSINPVSVSAIGVYTVTVTNGSGCSATATTNVVINALPVPTVSSNTPVCVGKSLDLTSSGGVSYAWVGPNGFVSSLQNPSINPVSILASGVYTVTVTNGSGCSATATTNVVINALPVPTVSSNTPVCVGKSLDLTSSGGLSYAWVGPNGFVSSLQNPSINPVSVSATGIYTVIVTNANGCSATATTNVIVNALPVPTVSSNTPVCVGKSLDLTASGGVNYAWLGPNGFTSNLQNPSINPVSLLASGVYTVTVTNANGCSATATTNVVINPLPVPTANSNTPVCVGKSLDLTASGGVNYAWLGPNGFTSNLQNPSINPVSLLASGVYTVTVTNVNGCSATATTNIIINALLVPTVSSNTPVCVGKSLDLTSSGGVSYAWAGPNAFSSSLQNPSINPVSILASGVYTVTVTNENGCSATATTNVIINALPVPTASSNTPVCVGKSLDLTSSGGESYAWVGSNGFSSSLQNPSINPVSISATCVYTVTVTNANGCSATATTNVIINALPIPSASSNTPVCVGKSLDLTASGGVSYAWTGPNGFVSSLQNPSINPVSISATGIYTVTVTNANGCSATATTNVVINALPVLTVSSNSPVCVGKSLDLSSSGGVSYTWLGPNGFISSLQNPSINPVGILATGIYTVTVTNANSCSATATTNVIINALPVPTVSSNSPVCVGKSLDLTSSGGVSYAWVGPSGFSSSLQNPSINPASISASGIYTVTVTNTNGCSATATTNVVINALPVPTISSNSPVCVGKSLDLASSGGVSYAWTGSNGFVSSLQNTSINPVSLLAAGIYTVTVTNANGCSATATTSVIINALPVPTVSSNTPVCVGKSLDLSSSGGVSYAWAGPNGFVSSLQNPSINPVSLLATGIYTVTVTNANGCSATTTTNVVINALPVPTVSSNSPVCVGKSLDLASSGGVSYAWAGPNGFTSSLQNPSINPVSLSAIGIYTVTVTNANGCSATATTNVIINALPVPTASSNTPVCVGKSLDLTSSGGVSYAWAGPNEFVSSLQNPSINPVSLLATGIYTVTVTNANGCSATATTNVVINALPVPTASSNSPVCVGRSLDLASSGGVSYSWAGPNGFVSSLQNPSINPVSLLATGIYTVTVTNANGCSATATTNVIINALPVPTASSNTPICVGKSLDLISSGGVSYAWAGPNAFSSSLQNSSINPVNVSATGVYTVTVTNANGCSATATTSVIINALPVPTVSYNTPVCVGKSLDLTSSGGVSYAWAGPNGFVSSLQNLSINPVSASATGIYTVTVTNATGCSATTTTNVVINALPVPTVSSNSPVCVGKSLDLASSGGVSYAWAGPNGFVSSLQNPTINPVSASATGIYTVTVVNANGCSATATTNVVINALPVPTVNSNTPVCVGKSLDLTSNGGVSYTWAGPNGFISSLQNPSINPVGISSTGIYTVTVTNANGCSATATTNVVINALPVPTASSNSPVCVGKSLDLTSNGGVSYAWAGPNGFVSSLQNLSINPVSTSAAGIYMVTVMNANGCSATATTNVVVNALPVPTVNSNTPVCVGKSLDLTASGGVSYAWAGPNGFISSLQNPSINPVSILATGVYTVTVTNANGCSSTATTNVVINALPVPTVNSNTPVCVGKSLDLTSSGGVSYAWVGPNGFTSSLQNPSINPVSLSASGIYTVTVTNGNGCSATVTTNVVINALPVPTASSNTPVCVGKSLDLTSSGGVSYAWVGPNGFASSLQNPSINPVSLSATGIYTVTVTNTNGCSTTATTNVVINALPVPTVSSNTPVCVGKSLDLTSSGGLNYAWVGPNGFSSSLQNPSINPVSVSATGIYTVTVTNANGCSATATTNVVVNTLPVPTASSNTPVCVGKSLDLTSSGGVSYAWVGPNGFASTLQNPSINPISVSSSGVYTVTVTNVNGCSATATTNVVINALPVPTVSSNTPVCVGKSLDLTSSGGVSYAWAGPNAFSSSLQNPSINPVSVSATGVYTVTVTNANGCSATATTSVIINALPVPTASSNTPICVGKSLDLISSGGVSYAWAGPNAFSSSLQNPSINPVSVSATGVYTVTVTNANGCSATATTSVIINALPVPTVSSNTPVCVGKSLDLTSSGGVSYAWAGPNGFVSSLQNPSINPVSILVSGVYIVTVTNANGCSATATTSVIINSLPVPTVSSNTPVCVGKSLDLTSSGGVSYAWVGPNGFSSSLQNPSINPVSLSATGIYTVTVTNVNGCSATATTNVVINALPFPTANSNTPVCVGKSLDLTSNGGVSYTWLGPNGFTSSSQNPSVNPVSISASGIYTVTVTNANGCSATATTNVVINALPVPTVNSNTPVCVGKSLDLTSSGGVSYAWAGPNGFASSLQNSSINPVSLSATGVYTVTVTNANGCSATAITSVVINPLPVALISSNSPVCETLPLNISAQASLGAVYAWSGPNGFSSTAQNPTIVSPMVADSGIYFLTVTSGDGCTATASANITIKKKPAATPSNDSPKCAGQNLQLNANNETGATYTWSGPNGFTSNLQNPIVTDVFPINTGIYQVIVDLDGCFNSATTSVTVYDNPVANPSSNSPVCEGQVLNFTAENAGAGATYLWTGINGFTSNLQNPSLLAQTAVNSAVFTLTVTQNGCTTTATTAITIKPKPTVNITAISPLCATENINLQAIATNGSSFQWSGPNGFVSSLQNPVINSSTTASTGVYEVIADLNGCLNNATTSITVNPKPDAIAMANSPVCETETVNLTANNAGTGAIYSWVGSNNFTSNLQNPVINNAVPIQSGIYTLTVQLGICFSTTTVDVTVFPKPTLSVGLVACQPNLKTYTVDFTSNATTLLTTAGTINNLGGNNYQIVGIPAGTNIVLTVKTDKNCIEIQNINAPDCSCPVVNAPVSNGDKVICEGDINPILSVSVGANETADWYSTPSGGSPLVDSTKSFTPTSTLPGTYTYYAETRNEINECKSATRTAVTFTIKPKPLVSLNANSPICETDSLKLVGNSSLAGVIYSWTGPNNYTSSLQNPLIANAIPSQSGYYKLLIDLNGCQTADSVNVLIKPKPQPIASSNSPVCEGFPLNISANSITNAIYKWSGPKAFTNENQNEIITNTIPACSGIYTLTVTLDGCVSTATTQVIVNAKPKISTSAPKCSVDLATYSLKFTALGGTVSSTAGVIVNDSLKNVPSGTNVKLYITSPEGCQDSVLINAPDCLCPPLDAPVSLGDTAICQTQPNPILAVNVNTLAGETVDWYDAANGGNLLQGNSLTYNPIPTAAGTYTYYAETRRADITIRTCVSSTRTPVKLIIKPLPLATALNNSPICQEDSLKLEAVAVSGANFSWTGPNGFVANAEDTLRFPAKTSMSGVYNLTVELAGCISTATTEVLVKPLPEVNALSNATFGLCENDTLTLTMPSATNPIDSYSWAGPNAYAAAGQTVKIIPASPSLSGVYTLITTLNGCKNQDTTNVLIKPLPLTIANNTSPVCEGDSVILSAADSPNATYEWFTPNGVSIGTGKRIVLTNTQPNQSGDYFVTVTLLDGCSDTSRTNVIIKRKPIALASGNTVCAGESIVLNAQKDSTATYLWSGPLGFNATKKDTILANAIVSQSGIYTLDVTLNGCTLSDTANVLVKPLPVTIALSNSPVCENAAIQLTAENAGTNAKYAWVGPNNFNSTLQNPVLDSATVVKAGIYTVEITLDGCKQTDTTLVVVKPLPSVSITANTPICEDDTLKLSVSSLLGATYAWSGANNFTSSQNAVQIPKVALNASGLYQVTVTKDACSKNDSVTISIKPKPLAQILSNSPVCEQDSLQLTAANAGVNATYTWSGPNGFTSNIQNPTVSPMTMAKAGKYILQVNLDNCIEYDTTEIVVKPLPILALSSNLPVCAEDTLKLFTGNNQLGTTFKWSGPAGFSDTTSTPVIPKVSVQQSGLYQVTAILNGCFKADSISVLIKPLPVAIASAKDDSLCVGETLELSAANAGIGANYAWEGPNGFISNEQSPVITPVRSSNAGKYILKVTLDNCEEKDTINIVVNPLPTLVIDSAKCTPDLKYYNVYYHASDSLVSSTAGIFENGILKNVPKDSLSVRLTVTTKFGCSISQEVTAPDCNCPVITAPTMNIQDTTICRGSTLPIFEATVGNRQTADWYDSPTGGTKIFTGLSYSLTTSDTLYVQARDTVSNCKSNVRTKVSLIINELPIASATTNSPVCQGDSLKLAAETVSGASYSWLGAGFTSTQQNPVINPAKSLDGGIYTLTVMLKGCVSTTTINTIVNPLPTLVIDSAKCTSDLKYYNVYYHASDSLVSSTAGVFENGILKNVPKDSLVVRLTVTTKFGCSISQEVTAPDCNCPVITAPTMNIQDTTICRGDIMPIFKANVGNRQTVDWYDSPTGGTKIFTGLSYSLTTSDTLYVQARDTVSNCKSNFRTKVSLIINELPIASATTNSPVCQGDSLKLSAETVNGASYSWSGIGFISTQQNPVINPAKVLDGGIYTLTVMLKGCVSTTTINAIVNPLPTLVIDSAKCTPDLKYYNVYYHASDSLVSSTAGVFENGILNNVPKDSLSVRLTVTTKFGCSISQEVTSPDCNCPVIAAPTMNIQDTTICRGDILPIFKANVGNRQTADWYDSPTGGTKIFTGLSYSLTTSDTLYVQARDTVSNCKSNVRTKVSLIINELPSFEVVGISAKCSGSVVENNGLIQLLTWASSNRFAYVKDSVFTENITYQNASSIPTDGLIIKNIAGDPTDVWYTIRIFNPSGCFIDKKVLLKKTICDCLPTPICTPFEVKKTKNRRVIP